jgi:demethylmenaquinone methyltransferase/2-methoxy-6-polyprenyl-1,4-benzoquinol methylase
MEKTIREEPWKADGEDKRVAVNSLFADVADSYDLVNSIMSFGLHYRWRKSAVKKIAVQRGDTVLDICCGTGDFLVPLSDAVGPEGTCCGLDFCEPMLDIAKSKLGDKAELTVGDACDLPYDSERFDAATVGWGIRNVPDIPAALSEAHRVLTIHLPHGRAVYRPSLWQNHRLQVSAREHREISQRRRAQDSNGRRRFR